MTFAPRDLERVQSLFWQLITHPIGVEAFLAEAPPETRAEVESLFAESPEFSRIERLEVYAQGYFYRILDTLAELFPLTRWRLSATAFHNLVTDYLLQFPSRSPDLGQVGDALPQFLQKAHPDTPLLAELAALERKIRTALDAPDGNAATPADLAAVPPERWAELRFGRTPSSSCLSTSIDYDAMKKAHDGGMDPQQLPSEHGLLENPRRTLVWRHNYRVFTRPLSEDEGWALCALWDGQSFGKLGELAPGRGLSPAAIVRFLSRWLADELLELKEA